MFTYRQDVDVASVVHKTSGLRKGWENEGKRRHKYQDTMVEPTLHTRTRMVSAFKAIKDSNAKEIDLVIQSTKLPNLIHISMSPYFLYIFLYNTTTLL